MAVLDRIFDHARATPDKTAVVHNGHALTYRRFAALVLLARRHFEAAGAGRGRLAILCVHSLIDGWIFGLALRSLGADTVIARGMADLSALGVQRACLVSTPTEARGWPELSAFAAQAGAPLIRPGLEAFDGWEAITLDRLPINEPSGGQLLLTSGTTGLYKKVRMDSTAEERDWPSRAKVFGFASDSVVNVFDFGLWTSVGHNVPVCVWSLGGGVGLQQGPHLRRFRGTPGMTHALVTPHMLSTLLEHANAEAAPRDDAVTLFVGAGALSAGQWRAARERLTDDVRAWVGATETGAFCATAVRDAEDLVWHRVAQDREAEIVDDAGRPLPAGDSGLVRVRPLGVSEYEGDPQTTRAFFRDGWFYSGDLGVIREDGRLALQGRVTDVINVLGNKHPALPIETLLQARLGAAAVCVFSAPGEAGDEVNVVIQPARMVSAEELKAALAEALPPGAPIRLHALEAFPRNGMGKIDRAELRRRLLPPRAR
jgi:acyl-CoA synthetase (AMP-forming)/AMP-acid ligase II